MYNPHLLQYIWSQKKKKKYWEITSSFYSFLTYLSSSIKIQLVGDAHSNAIICIFPLSIRSFWFLRALGLNDWKLGDSSLADSLPGSSATRWHFDFVIKVWKSHQRLPTQLSPLTETKRLCPVKRQGKQTHSDTPFFMRCPFFTDLPQFLYSIKLGFML